MSEQDEVVDLPRDALTGSVGTRLKQAREARGMSIDSVGRAIKLAPRQVEAIEADDFDSLMSPTYVRGFIRNYAALIGLDAQTLLGSLDQQHVRATPQLIEQANVGVAMPVQSARRKWLLPLLAMAGLALYVWFEFWPADVPVAGQPDIFRIEPSPLDGPASPDAADSIRFDPADASVSDVLPPPAELSSDTASDAIANTTPPEAIAAAAPGQHLLEFTFSTDSWVEIRDASDAIVLSDLNRSGSTRTVNATFPVSLVIGNARSVTLKVDGQPHDLAPSIKVDVARLRLE
ncbi:MAG: helix-turn-helix domain-containing protein [Methyloversatilis sp. 12-65-5]|nr:MAG: helix-turn-helix domain-containing protein [Methyloversatilis sp. 12-65-5]